MDWPLKNTFLDPYPSVKDHITFRSDLVYKMYTEMYTMYAMCIVQCICVMQLRMCDVILVAQLLLDQLFKTPFRVMSVRNPCDDS